MLRADTTLAVVLGASHWPHYGDRFRPSDAFQHASDAFLGYLQDTHGIGLPKHGVLSLFNDATEVVGQYDAIHDFLRAGRRAVSSTQGVEPDVLIYYVGHGSFFGANRSYCLLAQQTREPIEEDTSFRLDSLARVIRSAAPKSRRVLILDCCFAGAAARSFMSSLEQTAAAKAIEVVERGVAVVCASSSRSPARIAPNDQGTMFTDCLIDVLRNGDKAYRRGLSLRDVCELVKHEMATRYGDEAPRPEVQSPDQQYGDIAGIELFLNPGYVASPTATLEYEQKEDDEFGRQVRQIRAYIDRPTDEVRRKDGLRAYERHWVIYVDNLSDENVDDVHATAVANNDDETECEVDFGPVAAGHLAWYILRDDVRPRSGFGPDDDKPTVFINFRGDGRVWQRDGDELVVLGRFNS